MKIQWSFIFSCVSMVLGIYILPALIVDINFKLFKSIELQICIVQSVFLLLTQGVIDMKAIQKSVKTDKWSTYLIMGAGIISQITGVFEHAIIGFDVERNGFLQFAFLGIALSGNQIRIIAILKLAENFTPSIDKIEHRKLVDTWLFAYIRHPSYLGAMIFLLGNCLYLGSYFSFLFSLLLFIIVYKYRIELEEKQLEIYFGQKYKTYKKSTWRLIPYVW